MNTWDKLFYFFEKYGFLRFLLFLIGACLVIMESFFKKQTHITNILNYFLNDKEGTFITIAAIFIGIYFAIFSIFGSVKPSSVISKLSEHSLTRLIKYLRNALFGGFIYIFLTLFFSKDHSSLFWSYFNIVLFLSLLYMLLSAIWFGVYISFVVYGDMSKLYDEIKKMEEEDIRSREITNRLEIFLSEYEKIEREHRTEALSQLLKERKKSENTSS